MVYAEKCLSLIHWAHGSHIHFLWDEAAEVCQCTGRSAQITVYWLFKQLRCSRSLTLALSLQPLDRPHTHTEFTLACRVYIHWHCYCVRVCVCVCVCVCERERVLNGTCKGVLVGLRTRVSEGSPLVVIFPMTLTFWRNKSATLSVTWKCSLLLLWGETEHVSGKQIL